MKPTSFVPMVGEVSPRDAGEMPGLGPVISHWTDGGYSAEEWFRELKDDWGTAGFAVRRGGEVQGFAVYAPPERFAGAARYPLGPIDEDAVLLAYAGGDTRTRRRLLVRMLRDLRQRGVGSVQAIASDRGVSNHVPTSFLLESGWQPLRRAPYGMSYYTLVHIDLKSAVEVGELARALVGRVKLPGIGAPVPGAQVSTSAGQPVSTSAFQQEQRPDKRSVLAAPCIGLMHDGPSASQR